MSNAEKPTKKIIQVLALSIIIVAVVSSFIVLYRIERQEVFRGEANYELSYRYYFKNEGPLNLTSVTVRLAILKDWEPIQDVTGINIHTTPNQTTTDEYDNEFAWYEYSNFQVNQTIDLKFDVNVTLKFVDYNSAKLNILPYDEDTEQYKLFTAYHPLTDTTDPNIQRVSQSLSTSENPIDRAFNMYNFTSTYIRYQLMSSIKGATYALQNGEGDCDEYNTLFIALARAGGIPAVGHTAWLGNFEPGYESTDDGAIAHAFPMFFVEGVGMLPLDPTRGNKNFFDNWLKTDAKRITMTRGPDHPYRLLNYKWIPHPVLDDPEIDRNYSISITDLTTKYYSTLRLTILIALPSAAGIFIIASVIRGILLKKEQKEKLERILSPSTITKE